MRLHKKRVSTIHGKPQPPAERLKLIGAPRNKAVNAPNVRRLGRGEKKRVGLCEGRLARINGVDQIFFDFLAGVLRKRALDDYQPGASHFGHSAIRFRRRSAIKSQWRGIHCLA